MTPPPTGSDERDAMSIRLRLTIWYSALLGALLFMFSFGLYYYLANSLMRDVRATLQSQGQRAAALIERQIDPMESLSRDAISLRPQVIFDAQVYVQVLTPSGAVYERSANLQEVDQILPINQEMLDQTLAGATNFYTLHQNGAPIHIYVLPIHQADDKIVGVLQIGQSLADVNHMLGRVRTTLYVLPVLTLVAAAFGGSIIARRALRPIADITDTARRIGRTEHLAERITIPDSGDEISRLAETFNEMLARLDHLFQTQQRLVGDVSHELRTPLTTIQGNLDLLKRGAIHDPEMRTEALDEIETETRRMTRMVGDLLLLAQADAGHALHKVPVELDTLLLEVYRQALTIAQGKVEVRLAHEDQAQIIGDADRLYQLLLNLVDNAIKYTPAGGKVTLGLYRQANEISIVVTDTGLGIAPADLPHIFERFYRADRARSRRLGGAGLGLSIAQWVAQAHGGRIEVQSEAGQGSVFTLWLPLGQTATA